MHHRLFAQRTMMPNCHRWWVTLALLASVPAAAVAQQDTSARARDSTVEQAYQSQRSDLVKQLQATQDQLSALRSQRIELEARIENAIAQNTAKRASELLMSPEERALVELDSTLSVAQDNMQAQRDRMQALGDAVKRGSGAVLVVLLGSDSAQSAPLSAADLEVDGASAATRTYSAIAVQAIQQGAVDELYRAAVLPVAHQVSVKVTLGGEPVSQVVQVDAKPDVVTYVQFTIHGGQVAPSTWTSQGTTPF